MYGRDLLREGLIWRVGDGSNIRIHHDNWIPRKRSMKPLGQEFIQGITRVSDLLTCSGMCWDTHKVDAMFSESDAADIKQIPGGLNMQDYQAWNYMKNGVFNVRSAYHLRVSLTRARSGQPEG